VPQKMKQRKNREVMSQQDGRIGDTSISPPTKKKKLASNKQKEHWKDSRVQLGTNIKTVDQQ
jgi:hypothetical protein